MNVQGKGASYAVNYDLVNPQGGNPWRTSVLRRLPWLGLAAFFGVLLCMAAAVAILMESDGQPTDSWSVQPTVYLAIASALANILLHFALAEAVNIAWWRQTTQQGVKIADLHRAWSYGNSLWAALKSGRNINTIAIACMLVAIGPINGPLLQRASRVSVGRFSQNVNMKVLVAETLPDGYTGYLSGRGMTPALLTANFTKIVNIANTQAPVDVRTTGCTGKCATTIRGAGFAVNCSTSTAPYALIPTYTPGEEFDTGQQAMANGTQAFGSSIYWNSMMPGTVQLGVQYKPSPACNGELSVRNCTMRAAVVNYPVIVNGNKSTIELAPKSTMFDDSVYNLTTVAINTMTGPTTLGGLYKALRDTYSSTANLRFVGTYGYELITTGSTANSYAEFADTNSMRYANCSLFFRDPTEDLIRAIRDMMFRTAVAAADTPNAQFVTAQQVVEQPIYKSQYLYMALAVLFSALGWLAILPVFVGWWHVGRTVSMSPIETAKAFKAPMLESSDSNADASILLREVGDRPVRYGAVMASNGQVQRLEMNDPHYVRTPYPQQTFTG